MCSLGKVVVKMCTIRFCARGWESKGLAGDRFCDYLSSVNSDNVPSIILVGVCIYAFYKHNILQLKPQFVKS